MSKNIPRLEYEQLDPALAQVLAARVARLGYLGEFFRVAGHQPAALRGFVEFTESAKAALDKRHVELLALTIASEFGNAYERNQHERLSVRLGFGREWIREVERRDPDAAQGLRDDERLLQRFALETARSHGRTGGHLLDEIVSQLGVERAVAALMVIARYVAHAYVVNTLSLAPPVPSIWDDGFDGDGPPKAAEHRA